MLFVCGVCVQLKNDFVELLREQKTLSVRSQWKKVKGAIADDSRYKAVESSSLREDYFKEYVKTLTDTVSGFVSCRRFYGAW